MNGRRAGEGVAKAIETERFKYEMEHRVPERKDEEPSEKVVGPGVYEQRISVGADDEERAARLRKEENVRVTNVFRKLLDVLDTLETLEEKRRVLKATMICLGLDG